MNLLLSIIAAIAGLALAILYAVSPRHAQDAINTAVLLGAAFLTIAAAIHATRS